MHRLEKIAGHLSPTDGSMESQPVIVAAKRTPMGAYKGQFKNLKATQLGSICIQSALGSCQLSPSDVTEVFFGNVLSANVGQAPARQAALGVGVDAPSTTINKVCASGLKAVTLAALSVLHDSSQILVAGGMESMSNVPHYLEREKVRDKQSHEMTDGLIKDGLTDAYDHKHMGVFAEQCSTRYNISREAQDQYAIQSYERAIHATQNDYFHHEIAATNGHHADQGPQSFRPEKIPQLRPAFMEGGTVTAANSSSLSDGASALILTSFTTAQQRQLPILARIVCFEDAVQAPNLFTTTPTLAIEKVLKKAQLSISEIDLFEVNEAFAVVALANLQLLGADISKMNICGGAIALGHPLGCSGARILTTLVHQLRRTRKRYGIAAICNGGGGATAVLVENSHV